MLIYEKIVNSVRKLFGTLNDIPDATDEEVVYLDEDDVEVEITAEDGPFTDDSHGGIVIGDGTKIKVQIDDIIVIPKE